MIVGTPHAALETTTLGGHVIPAGTTLVSVLSAVHHDRTCWVDPENFCPERFLDDDGKIFPADHSIRKRVQEFGTEPRVGVGETFALKRIFIFLTCLIQSFDLHPSNGQLTPCDYKSYKSRGFNLIQQTYMIKLLPRQQMAKHSL